MRKNIILDVDSYKMSHPFMYPPKTTGLFSYAESRGGVYDESVFFGLQGFIKDNWLNPVTMDDVVEAEAFCTLHGVPFDLDGWVSIVTKHGGYLPLKVRAVKEGSVLPVKVPLVTVENTDEKLPWLTSYVETALLRAVWYPTTIATKSRSIKMGIKKLWDKAATSGASPDFAFLDFSSRGVEAYEANCVGGAAFLTSFQGSDSIPAVRWVNDRYNCNMAGFSVKATEHSVMCSYGQDNEYESFKHLVENVAKPGDILSVVSDTWNIYEACKYWNGLASIIQKKGINLVIRPDSGDYKVVLRRMLQILGSGSFGKYINKKGYLAFTNLKILWGDGVSEDTYEDMIQTVMDLGYSPEVLVLGSGGGLMQNVNRDTMKFAFKASAVKIGSEWKGIAKNPITDPGKQSKQGRLDLVRNSQGIVILNTCEARNRVFRDEISLLETVYENGRLVRNQSLDEIRKLVASCS